MIAARCAAAASMARFEFARTCSIWPEAIGIRPSRLGNLLAGREPGERSPYQHCGQPHGRPTRATPSPRHLRLLLCSTTAWHSSCHPSLRARMLRVTAVFSFQEMAFRAGPEARWRKKGIALPALSLYAEHGLCLWLFADYENAARGAASADIQHRERLRVFDLIIAGLAGYLPPAIEHLAHSRRSDRMAGPDKPAGGIDRAFAAHLDYARLDRLPGLARLAQAEVIDRHVLGGGKAVVGFDCRELLDARDSRPLESIEDCLARMRQHVGIVLALGNLGVELDGRGVMAPSEDAWNVAELEVVSLGPLARIVLRGEEKRDAAVRHLRTVAHLDAAADDGVELRSVLRVALAHEPVAGLRVGIALGVRIIDGRDMREVLVLEAEALVVFIAEPSEQFGEGKLDALGLALVPGRGAQIVAAGCGIDRLHLFHARDAGEVVPAGFDFG